MLVLDFWYLLDRSKIVKLPLIFSNFGMNISKSIITAIACGSIAICSNSSPALAQSGETCRVTDPTGSLLNIRLTPNGKIIAKIRNRTTVYPQSYARADNGKTWALISMKRNGNQVVLGWVLREFVSCY